MTFLLANWKWIGLLALGIILFSLIGYIKLLKTENRELAKNAEIAEARIMDLNKALIANQTALTARINEVKLLTQEKNEIIANLRKLYETNEEACVWGDSYIPKSIYSQLCEQNS
ncbi:MAG: hypothetical protein LBI10_06960 [Deltaproteobacteria bacterium]|jgi:hypothetical protein|nr:hypothetical protein [Deltaproteobacteria bacterium]